ncbi:MAG TPA: TadE family protein [Anaerolineae bacterium]|nr:TadE family protein [Anaerolineae bacterium]
MGHKLRGESGQGIVLFALVMVVLLAFIALAVDVGLAFVRSAQFSAAIDAAALAATIDLDPNDDSTFQADIRAEQFLGANGWPTSTLTSMISSRSYTQMGLPTYSLTATWPVDFYFARAIGLSEYSVTRKATASYYAQAEMLTPSAAERGHVRTASQFIFGPSGCAVQGDPVSTRLSTPDATNGYYPMFDGEFDYRIVVDENYVASDVLRVELFDPDSYNNRPDNTMVQHSLSDGRPAKELDCQAKTAGAGDRCVIETGESVTAINQNPFWLQRVDVNWGDRCEQLNQDGFGDVVTTYELFFRTDSGERQALASYTVDNARDYLHSDLKWVSPGASSSLVPADDGSFEIDLSVIPVNDMGQRTIEMEVQTSSGSGKNVWDLWAGPPLAYFAANGIPSLSADVNQRNLQLANNPADYSIPGISVFAIGRMPLTHYVDNASIKLPLAPIESTQGGGIVYATAYDLDPSGGSADINFTIDTVAEGDFKMFTAVVDAPNSGRSGSSADPLQATCKGSRDCNGRWMLPQYAMRIPRVFFSGGTLEANYTPRGDDHVWSAGVTAGRPFLTK